MSSIESESLYTDNTPSPQGKSSIRLSTLNPQVREKLVKFDTANDGELSLEEAIHGLVTLQKQSNNYKRMLYLLVPLMTVMLACVLGVNILAIQLTKDLSSSTTSGNPVLTNVEGKVLSTVSYSETMGLLNWLNNYEYSLPDHIEINGLSMNVNSMYLEEEFNITRLYVNTQMVNFYLGSDGTYDIDFNNGYSNNIFAQKALLLVNNELETIQDIIINSQSKFIQKSQQRTQINVGVKLKPTPRAKGGGFGCRVIGTVCSSTTK